MIESEEDPTVELPALSESACVATAALTPSEFARHELELQLCDETNAVLQAGIEEFRGKCRRLEDEVAALKSANESLTAQLKAGAGPTASQAQPAGPAEVDVPAGVEKDTSGSYAVNGRIVTIGSAPDSDIRIDSKYVSHRHAQLVMTRKGCVLSDLDSTNGTYINSRRIVMRTLEPGDTVTVGKHRFTYEQRPGHSDYHLNPY